MYSLVRSVTGAGEMEVPAGTPREALQWLAERFGEEFRAMIYEPDSGLRPGVQLLCRGRNVSAAGQLDTVLDPGEALDLFSGIEGG